MNNLETPPNGQNNAQTLALTARSSSGANWFYWIAALSLINSITALLHISAGFVIGLVSTQILDAIAAHTKVPALTTVFFVVDIVIIGLYAVFGLFANKRQNWAFIVGLVFYGSDTLILLLNVALGGSIGSSLFSILFHGWAIFGIWNGLQANMNLNKLIAEQKRAEYYGQQPQQPYYQPPTDPTKLG